MRPGPHTHQVFVFSSLTRNSTHLFNIFLQKTIIKVYWLFQRYGKFLAWRNSFAVSCIFFFHLLSEELLEDFISHKMFQIQLDFLKPISRPIWRLLHSFQDSEFSHRVVKDKNTILHRKNFIADGKSRMTS